MSLHAASISDAVDTESIQTAPIETASAETASIETAPVETAPVVEFLSADHTADQTDLVADQNDQVDEVADQNDQVDDVADQNAKVTDRTADPVEPSFADLGLPRTLLRAVNELGFSTPTAIQAAAIPALLGGRDITGIAQTGTGKTAAFGLPLLAAVDATPGVQALVLCPTRELAVQVADAIASFATSMPAITVVPIYGGTGFLPQRAALKAGAQVVVGTPGRIIDHLERGTLDLSGLRFMVLDEADEMLRMGFAEDVDRILSDSPASRQTALFSATMPPPIRAIANRHMTNPMDIAVSRQSSTVDSVRQIYAVVPFRDKSDALARFLQVTEGDAAIVFVRTKEACDQVGADLVARGVTAAVMNGDVPQKEREKIIERLRDGRLDVLVATDVAARGLDVDRIDLVVNFDAPGEPEAYVHRIGRTGRAGRTGTALTFFTPREMSRLRAIERATRGTLEQIVPPTADEVAAHKAASVLRKALARFDVGRLQHQNRLIRDLLAEHDLTGEELAAALLALAAGDDGAEPEPAPEPASFDRDRKTKVRSASGTAADRPRSGAERSGRTRAPFGRRYRVAVGHRDGVRPAGIVGAITGEGGVTGKDLGKIDIYDSYSTVEIGTELSPAALGRIANAKVSGRTLRIEPDRDEAQGRRPWAGQRDSHGPRRAGGASPDYGHAGRGYRAGH